eukprot:gene6223-4480_t
MSVGDKEQQHEYFLSREGESSQLFLIWKMNQRARKKNLNYLNWK